MLLLALVDYYSMLKGSLVTNRYLTMNKLTLAVLVFGCVLSLGAQASEETDSRPLRSMPSFDSVDTDGDGLISVSELEAYRSSMPMQQANSSSAKQINRRDSVSAFASFDKNKDGVISPDEFSAHSRYSNPGNGTGDMKMNKEKAENRNNSKNSNSSGKGNGNKSN